MDYNPDNPYRSRDEVLAEEEMQLALQYANGTDEGGTDSQPEYHHQLMAAASHGLGNLYQYRPGVEQPTNRYPDPIHDQIRDSAPYFYGNRSLDIRPLPQAAPFPSTTIAPNAIAADTGLSYTLIPNSVLASTIASNPVAETAEPANLGLLQNLQPNSGPSNTVSVTAAPANTFHPSTGLSNTLDMNAISANTGLPRTGPSSLNPWAQYNTQPNSTLPTPPSVSPTTATMTPAPYIDSEYKQRAKNSSIDNVDPYLCYICFHGCVRRESVKRHLMDFHDIRRDKLQEIFTKSEHEAKGLSTIYDPNKCPKMTVRRVVPKAEKMAKSIKTESKRAEVKIEPSMNKVKIEPSMSNVKTEPSMSNVKTEPSMSNVKIESSMNNVNQDSTHLNYQNHNVAIQPDRRVGYHTPTFDYSNPYAIDATIAAIRAMGEPHSTDALANIAKASLEQLDGHKRALIIHRTWPWLNSNGNTAHYYHTSGSNDHMKKRSADAMEGEGQGNVDPELRPGHCKKPKMEHDEKSDN